MASHVRAVLSGFTGLLSGMRRGAELFWQALAYGARLCFAEAADSRW
jgi:hypothetical protein